MLADMDMNIYSAPGTRDRHIDIREYVDGALRYGLDLEEIEDSLAERFGDSQVWVAEGELHVAVQFVD